MFSSKGKTEKKHNSSSTSETHHHVSQNSQTSKNLTIQSTYQLRSHSVCYSHETQQGQIPGGFPTTSLTSLSGLTSGSNLAPPANTYKANSSSMSSLGTRTDAKPFTPTSGRVNLNYQSPFRNSPVYSSYRGAAPQTAAPSVRNPPAILMNKTSPNKKLVVKKTGRTYDSGGLIPTYKTSSQNRGEVLIINNIMFEGKDERKGAKVDHERLENLLKQIGFKVTLKTDLKAAKMKTEIETFSKRSSLKKADISMVVVMSHGTKNAIEGGTEVFGIDDNGLLVEDILSYFTGDKCKSMQDKPKIFIFQCCRGSKEQMPLTDAKSNKPRPHSDMLIAYSTLPGFVSYRDPTMGTWYIQTICDVFSQHAHEYHVEELLKIVDVELASLGGNGQTSSYESRGFKRCYLHPK